MAIMPYMVSRNLSYHARPANRAVSGVWEMTDRE